jgi:ABC-type lipoprotein release transport system permease subunit
LALVGTALGTIWDPPTLVAAAFTLFVSALLASYVPTRHAASVDPIEVLSAD